MRSQQEVLTNWAKACVAGFILVASAPSWAQQSTSSSAMTNRASTKAKAIAPQVEPETPLVSGSFAIDRATSLNDFKDGTRQDGIDYILNLGLNLSKTYNLSLRSGFSQDLHDSQKDDFADSIFSLNHATYSWGRYLQISPSVAAIAPTSKSSSQVENLQGAGRLGATFSLNPLINPQLALGLTLSGGQNFHAYETDINGAVLNKYAFRQTFAVGYSWGPFALSGTFIHKNGVTYQNNLTEAFEHVEEASYTYKKYSFALGHTNKGAAFKENGSDSNYALINENDSVVYGALTFIF